MDTITGRPEAPELSLSKALRRAPLLYLARVALQVSLAETVTHLTSVLLDHLLWTSRRQSVIRNAQLCGFGKTAERCPVEGKLCRLVDDRRAGSGKARCNKRLIRVQSTRAMNGADQLLSYMRIDIYPLRWPTNGVTDLLAHRRGEAGTFNGTSDYADHLGL